MIWPRIWHAFCHQDREESTPGWNCYIWYQNLGKSTKNNKFRYVISIYMYFHVPQDETSRTVVILDYPAEPMLLMFLFFIPNSFTKQLYSMCNHIKLKNQKEEISLRPQTVARDRLSSSTTCGNKRAEIKEQITKTPHNEFISWCIFSWGYFSITQEC